MVGSDLSVKGGMTSVVESFLNNDFKGKINIQYVPTHLENVSTVNKMIFFMKSLFTIVKSLIFNDISIAHIHMSERGSFFRKYIVFILARMFHKKVIIHLHGAEFKEFYYNVNKIIKKMILHLLKSSDKVLVLGDSWENFIKELDNSIDTVILRNSVKYPIEKVEFNGSNINILFLAMIIKRKGIFDLIEAAKIIKNNENLKNYNIKFIIAGTGEEEGTAKQKVKEYGLQEYFDFKGWVNKQEKIQLLKESQIFVLPSYNEGLPVAILEAMSYGLPIVATDVGSVRDAVIDNYNGILINAGDIKALAKSIEEIIFYKDKWIKFSLNSKKIIEEYYEERRYFEKVEQLYNNVLMIN